MEDHGSNVMMHLQRAAGGAFGMEWPDLECLLERWQAQHRGPFVDEGVSPFVDEWRATVAHMGVVGAALLEVRPHRMRLEVLADASHEVEAFGGCHTRRLSNALVGRPGSVLLPAASYVGTTAAHSLNACRFPAVVWNWVAIHEQFSLIFF